MDAPLYVSEDVWSHKTWNGNAPPSFASPTVAKGSKVWRRGQAYSEDGRIWQGIRFRGRDYEIWVELLLPEPPTQQLPELQEIEFARGKPPLEAAGRAAK